MDLFHFSSAPGCNKCQGPRGHRGEREPLQEAAALQGVRGGAFGMRVPLGRAPAEHLIASSPGWVAGTRSLPVPRPPGPGAPHLQDLPPLTVDGDQIVMDGDELLRLCDEERSAV